MRRPLQLRFLFSTRTGAAPLLRAPASEQQPRKPESGKRETHSVVFSLPSSVAERRAAAARPLWPRRIGVGILAEVVFRAHGKGMFPPLKSAAADNSPQPRPGSSVVERGPEKAGVGGSIPSLATIPNFNHASISGSVLRLCLALLGVAQDFACGLRRPQNGSSSIPSVATIPNFNHASISDALLISKKSRGPRSHD
jgi:hypothetical protein